MNGGQLLKETVFFSQKVLLLFFHHEDVFGPPQVKTCLRAYADNEGSDQPSHQHSLIGAFIVC